MDLSLPTQTYFFTPDSAFVNLVPNDTDWKDGDDITLGLSSSNARPDSWRMRWGLATGLLYCQVLRVRTNSDGLPA